MHAHLTECDLMPPVQSAYRQVTRPKRCFKTADIQKVQNILVLTSVVRIPYNFANMENNLAPY